ncbi:unnamed protein product [Didymodactylos carnosus]|uniref:Uncharacterized protein n=1 Tax=Didymodactylos carnosus TaxID=1234261 RepID=A0A815LQ41_9BILA|nr:unnamed protein product [Didymodactylos carnosus]CAF1413199.1 unnamed protein product [Didymodactylos carnosus]CAF3806991.1 unnamed protein product [Didymodactylos carnosus]CAF4300638.1 unnamed protein product [Didymodactylos carnosus]
MNIACSMTISDDELQNLKILLDKFIQGFENLYGVRHMVQNIHCLNHIYDCVKQNGRMPHYTTFNYENILGILNRLTHGTNGHVQQIITHLKLFKISLRLVRSKHYPKQLYDFVLNLFKHQPAST